jgi:hypothetical protein
LVQMRCFQGFLEGKETLTLRCSWLILVFLFCK